jgi:hypothetical protein
VTPGACQYFLVSSLWKAACGGVPAFSRIIGSLSLGGGLRVRFEANTISGERLKLVGRIGSNTANGTSAIAVAVMLGVAWWSAFRAHLVFGIAVAVGILGLSFLIVLIGQAIFEPDCEGLFDIVKSAVDGDGWRAV